MSVPAATIKTNNSISFEGLVNAYNQIDDALDNRTSKLFFEFLEGVISSENEQDSDQKKTKLLTAFKCLTSFREALKQKNYPCTVRQSLDPEVNILNAQGTALLYQLKYGNESDLIEKVSQLVKTHFPNFSVLVDERHRQMMLRSAAEMTNGLAQLYKVFFHSPEMPIRELQTVLSSFFDKEKVPEALIQLDMLIEQVFSYKQSLDDCCEKNDFADGKKFVSMLVQRHGNKEPQKQFYESLKNETFSQYKRLAGLSPHTEINKAEWDAFFFSLCNQKESPHLF